MSFGVTFSSLFSDLFWIRKLYASSKMEDGRLMFDDKDLTDKQSQGIVQELISSNIIKPCGRCFKASFPDKKYPYSGPLSHKVLSMENLTEYMSTGKVEGRTPVNIYPVNQYEILLPTYEDFVKEYKERVLSAFDE